MAKVLTKIVDKNIRIEDRITLLLNLLETLRGRDECDEVIDAREQVETLVNMAVESESAGAQRQAEMEKTLTEIISAMMAGPKRSATYMGQTQGLMHLRSETGKTIWAVPNPKDETKLAGLSIGDEVLVNDAETVALCLAPPSTHTPDVATVDAVIDDDRILVQSDHDTSVIMAKSQMLKAKNGQLRNGQRLIVCGKRRIAYDTLPDADSDSKYRHRDTGKLTHITDDMIGAVPTYINQIVQHVERELLHPEIQRKYRQQRSLMYLLQGISGSGKTYSILHLIYRLHCLMARIAGIKVCDMPQRVMRLRMASTLSMYVGQSDRNIDTFYREVAELADESFMGHTLPVIAIGEEIDALARNRGDDSSGAIFDRIMTTVLDRMDSTSTEVADRLVVYLYTTNVPHLIDPAFLRRAGGVIAHFGRLDEEAFNSVLAAQMLGMPQTADAQSMVKKYIFADEALFAVLYRNTKKPSIKSRSDMLTHGLVNRSVQQAARMACQREHNGGNGDGVTGNDLTKAFDAQLRGILSQLQTNNVRQYVDLNENMIVSNVIHDLNSLRQAADRGHASIVWHWTGNCCQWSVHRATQLRRHDS